MYILRYDRESFEGGEMRWEEGWRRVLSQSKLWLTESITTLNSCRHVPESTTHFTLLSTQN